MILDEKSGMYYPPPPPYSQLASSWNPPPPFVPTEPEHAIVTLETPADAPQNLSSEPPTPPASDVVGRGGTGTLDDAPRPRLFRSRNRDAYTLATLPPHILLRIVHSTFPPKIGYGGAESQRENLFWLETSLRLVSRSFYLTCMHILRATYLKAYKSLVRPPYTADPLSSSTSIKEIVTPNYRELRTLDLFIALLATEDIMLDSTSLYLPREEAYKDLFDLVQPRSRLEDLVRIEGVRNGTISVQGYNPPSATRSSFDGATTHSDGTVPTIISSLDGHEDSSTYASSRLSGSTYPSSLARSSNAEQLATFPSSSATTVTISSHGTWRKTSLPQTSAPTVIHSTAPSSTSSSLTPFPYTPPSPGQPYYPYPYQRSSSPGSSPVPSPSPTKSSFVTRLKNKASAKVRRISRQGDQTPITPYPVPEVNVSPTDNSSCEVMTFDSTNQRQSITPIPFSCLSVSFSPRAVKLLYDPTATSGLTAGTVSPPFPSDSVDADEFGGSEWGSLSLSGVSHGKSRKRTLVEVHRHRDDKLEDCAVRLVHGLLGMLEEG